MSSDVDDDQVLPESLQKLEIVPIYPQSQTACKTNNERNQNPFFSQLSTANGLDDRVSNKKKITPFLCKLLCILQQQKKCQIFSCVLFKLYADNQRPVWSNV